MTKRRLIPLFAGTAVMLLAGLVLIRAQQSEPAHPDTQKLIIENMLVRVYDIHVPPGVAEPMHHHGRGVTVALSDYDNETKSPEGKISRGHNKFGEVRWAEPVTHEAKNIGTTEQHVVRIELKQAAPYGAKYPKISSTRCVGADGNTLTEPVVVGTIARLLVTAPS